MPASVLSPPVVRNSAAGHLTRESPRKAADSILQHALDRAFAAGGYASLNHIRTIVRDGRVALHGRVESWHLKQVAQEIALPIVGLGRVQNRLLVTETAHSHRS